MVACGEPRVGTTSVPLRFLLSQGPSFGGTVFRRDLLVRSAFSEGPACQVRRAMLDYPRPFIGHDERAPPMVQPLPGPPGARGGRELSPRVRGDVRGAASLRFRRDLPVRSAESRLMMHFGSAGTINVPLRAGEKVVVSLSTDCFFAILKPKGECHGDSLPALRSGFGCHVVRVWAMCGV